jgi:hypothetical protein
MKGHSDEMSSVVTIILNVVDLRLDHHLRRQLLNDDNNSRTAATLNTQRAQSLHNTQ